MNDGYPPSTTEEIAVKHAVYELAGKLGKSDDWVDWAYQMMLGLVEMEAEMTS